MITLSNRQRKAMDRVGGANLILDWPAALPRGATVDPDHEREAKASEKAAAEAMVKPACEAAGLVPVHVRVINVRRPTGYPRADQYEQHLAVTIIGRRWVHASGRHNPPDVWPTAEKDRIKTARDYRAALRKIERVMQAAPNTPEGELLARLVDAIEEWESINYPLE